jgi:SAM-dependent methyltransferase
MGELTVPVHLQRSVRKDPELARASARALLADLTRCAGRDSLAGLSILDVGCGVKFSEALVNDRVPVGSYTGVDVEPTVIEFLAASVHDERFSYHRVDFANARYNPGGEPMSASSELPVERDQYDVICGFSLFTHLDPQDFESMLAILRRYARASTRLVFTVFLDELSESGHGFIDGWSKRSGVDARRNVPYCDAAPEDVLRVALYSRELVLELLERTRWRALSVDDPTPFAQHLVTAVPV